MKTNRTPSLWIALPFTGLLSQPNRTPAAEAFSMEDYPRVEKIDIHVHLRTDNTQFSELARQDNFRFLNIAVHSPDPEEMALKNDQNYFRTHPEYHLFSAP